MASLPVCVARCPARRRYGRAMRSSILLLAAVGCGSPAKPAAPSAPAEPAPTAAASTVAASTRAAPPAAPGLHYPAAPTGDVVETHHGVAVADPYRWLEDMGSAETRRWVSDENAVTDAYLGRVPGRD